MTYHERRMRRALMALHTGDLSPRGATRAARHVRSCTVCRATLSAWERAESDLRLARPEPVALDPERAQALGLPVQFWSRLQHGESIEYKGQTVTPDSVLGPPRRGISFAFITDTRPTRALAEFARDVDLLICESMYDDPEDLPLARANAHMLAEESAGIAADAGAHALILTHFSPKISDPSRVEKAAQRVFANTRAARDGMVVTLDYS